MTKQRLLCEWPLAVFTLTIQVACGIAIATTVAANTQSAAEAPVRALAIAVFPTICAGLLISLMHLGRPSAAWRALSNPRSRLSWEVLLTSAFAASAFVCSLAWWTGGTEIRSYTGAAASALGIATVIASARIYKLPAKPIWNSGWVMTSFIGSTVTFAGLALWVCSSSFAIAAILGGSALLFLSASAMWRKSSRMLEGLRSIHFWFIAYLLLAIVVPLSLIFRTNSAPIGVSLAACMVVVGIFAGRLLMFALSELEPRF